MMKALQASLLMSLTLGFVTRQNPPTFSVVFLALKDQKVPPGIHEDQHAVQTQVQAIPATRLLIADAPVFHFSLEFFFYLFHGTHLNLELRTLSISLIPMTQPWIHITEQWCRWQWGTLRPGGRGKAL